MRHPLLVCDPFHETLPRSSVSVNWLSVRFYEMDCSITEIKRKLSFTTSRTHSTKQYRWASLFRLSLKKDLTFAFFREATKKGFFLMAGTLRPSPPPRA